MQADSRAVTFAADNQDAALRLQAAKLVVAGPFGHGFAFLPNSQDNPTASRLETNDDLVKPLQPAVAQDVQVDGLLVGVELGCQVVVKLLQNLFGVHVYCIATGR